jgi:hypothetical protein
MNIKKIAQLACLAAAIGAGTAAHATVVDFNDQPYSYQNTNFVSNGFRFVSSGPFGYAFTTASQVCSPECPVSGSTELLMPYGPSSVTLTAANSSPFDLASFMAAGTFDLSSWGPNYTPTTINVVGHLVTGGTVTESFQIASTGSGPLPFTLETANASFTNLSSVTFSSSGSAYDIYNGFALDDVNVTAVPENSSTALMLAGLGLVGLVARRRKARG